MSLDAVLKVGGSLSRGDRLHGLCQEIGRVGLRYRLLVVPGGGEFADLVRNHYSRYSLGETTAHRMALLAMDQYGCLLGDLVPGSRSWASHKQPLRSRSGPSPPGRMLLRERAPAPAVGAPRRG